MKPICPCCQSSAVVEMTDDITSHLLDEIASPAVWVGLGIRLCQTLNVHPAVGMVVSTALALLINKPYRCSACTHVFTLFK